MIVSGLSKVALDIKSGATPDLESAGLILAGIGFFLARDVDRTDMESGAAQAEVKRHLKKMGKK